MNTKMHPTNLHFFERNYTKLLAFTRSFVSTFSIPQEEMDISQQNNYGYDFMQNKSRSPVGVPGFEPRTSCSQSTRATKLRHTPFDVTDSIVDKQTALNHLLAIYFFFSLKLQKVSQNCR